MATHSSILAWRISWTEEPGRLQSMGSQRVRHDWNDLACTHTSLLKKSHDLHPHSGGRSPVWSPVQLLCHGKYLQPISLRSAPLAPSVAGSWRQFLGKAAVKGREGAILNKLDGQLTQEQQCQLWAPRIPDWCWLLDWHPTVPRGWGCSVWLLSSLFYLKDVPRSLWFFKK